MEKKIKLSFSALFEPLSLLMRVFYIMITCTLCKQTKEENEYTPVPTNKTGRHTCCRKCEIERQNMVLKAEDMRDQTIVEEFKTIMVNLGYDISGDINKQFLDRVRDKYGVILD